MRFVLFGILVFIYLILGLIAVAVIPKIIYVDYDDIYYDEDLVTVTICIWPFMLLLVIFYRFGLFLEQKARELNKYLKKKVHKTEVKD